VGRLLVDYWRGLLGHANYISQILPRVLFQEPSVRCGGVSTTQPRPRVRAGSGSGRTMWVRGRPTTWRWPSPSRTPTTGSSPALTWRPSASATSLIFRPWHRCVWILHMDMNEKDKLTLFSNRFFFVNMRDIYLSTRIVMSPSYGLKGTVASIQSEPYDLMVLCLTARRTFL